MAWQGMGGPPAVQEGLPAWHAPLAPGTPAATAQCVVEIGEGEARARRLTRQLDFRRTRHADRREVAILGEGGGKVGATWTGIHHLRPRRRALRSRVGR